MRYYASKTDLSPYPPSSVQTSRSKAVPQLQLLFVCVSVVSYVRFVVSSFVPHLSFLRFLGKARHHDFGISRVSSLGSVLNRKPY